MRSETGATASELAAAVGWQVHSVRGFIAGTLKKRAGMRVTATRVDGVTRYRGRGCGEGRGMKDPDALEGLSLEDLRTCWRARYGAPPALRSAELLALMLAWRIQAGREGGLEADLRRVLRRPARVRAPPEPCAGPGSYASGRARRTRSS